MRDRKDIRDFRDMTSNEHCLKNWKFKCEEYIDWQHCDFFVSFGLLLKMFFVFFFGRSKLTFQT
jgi:hypothetical protein